MPDDLNLVTNPRFTEGKRCPRRWKWATPDETCLWRRRPSPNGDGLSLMEIRTGGPEASPDAPPHAVWAQRVSVKGGQHYRIEATVSVDGGDPDRRADEGGMVLSVQPMAGEKRIAEAVETPPLRGGEARLRAFYQTPPGTRALALRVGVRGPGRRATIHEVTVIPIAELEVKSHPNAVPPPPYADPVPRRVRTICVYDDRGARRPLAGDATRTRPAPGQGLVDILRARFGRNAVRMVRPTQIAGTGGVYRADRKKPRWVDADAILIPGMLPPGLRSMSSLQSMAEHHLVVLSLAGLAKLSRGAIEVRTVKQKDDPISATVYESNFITRGFALRDVFSYAACGIGGDDPRIFVQRQFRQTASFHRFCKLYNFRTVLRSETDSDATSGKPVALYAETPGGGIFVIDLEPIESQPSTWNEPNLALFILLNALGAEQASLGRYTVPARTHREFWEELWDFGQRFPEFTLQGADPPYREDMRLLVQLGRDPAQATRPPMPGLQPSAPVPGGDSADPAARPVILIRTGLTGDDLHGVYGTMQWLAQLVRPVPYPCPYARMLTERYRLVWVPHCAAWPHSTGWRGTPGATAAFEADFDPNTVAAVIDVTNCARQDLRVIVPQRGRAYARYEALLPGLWRQLHTSRYFYRAPQEGEWLGDHRASAWRRDVLIPRVSVDAAPFANGFHRAAAAGARLIRLETPNSPADMICNSIWRTEQVASMLELVVGLQFGLLVVNRRRSNLRLALPAEVASDPERALVLRSGSDPGQVESSPLPLTPGPPCGRRLKSLPGQSLTPATGPASGGTGKVTLRPGDVLWYVRS